MRLALLLGCAVALVVALQAPLAPAASATALRIRYDEDSTRPGRVTTWTLRCDPVGGDHPRRAAVCRTLARVGWRAFLPVPRDTACAELYGGPQVALVTGLVDGRRVWARLSRVDGCQIERWGRVAGLLPRGGVR